jgi:hypothetical protein
MSPDGRGTIWKRSRRRNRERRIPAIADCGLRIPELKNFSEAGGRRIMLSMAQRMMIKRMPSSINEKAQSSTEPKAMGVKMRRKMRMDLMKKLIMV